MRRGAADRRAALDEASAAGRAANAHISNRVPRDLVARISTKLQAALWVAALIALFAYGGVGGAAFDPQRSNP